MTRLMVLCMAIILCVVQMSGADSLEGYVYEGDVWRQLLFLFNDNYNSPLYCYCYQS